MNGHIDSGCTLHAPIEGVASLSFLCNCLQGVSSLLLGIQLHHPWREPGYVALSVECRRHLESVCWFQFLDMLMNHYSSVISGPAKHQHFMLFTIISLNAVYSS